MPYACSPGERDCYVNANFMIDLRARKKAAWRRRRARRFAQCHPGRLFTYERFIAKEVPDRIRLSNMHNILIIADCGDIARMNRIFSLAADLIEWLGRRHTLTENTLRDLEHVAAAIVLGARFYVTSDTTVCSWINEDYPHLFSGLVCVNHREGETCGLAGEEGHAAEDRGAGDNTLVREGCTGRGQEGSRRGEGGLRAGRDNERGSPEKTKTSGKRKRKGKKGKVARAKKSKPKRSRGRRPRKRG